MATPNGRKSYELGQSQVWQARIRGTHEETFRFGLHV